MDFRKIFQLDSQHLWLGLKGPIIAVKGCSPPQELDKAARKVTIFLVYINQRGSNSPLLLKRWPISLRDIWLHTAVVHCKAPLPSLLYSFLDNSFIRNMANSNIHIEIMQLQDMLSNKIMALFELIDKYYIKYRIDLYFLMKMHFDTKSFGATILSFAAPHLTALHCKSAKYLWPEYLCITSVYLSLIHRNIPGKRGYLLLKWRAICTIELLVI